jgi:hypothetical protein
MLLFSGKLQVMRSWEFRFQKTMLRAIQLSQTSVRVLCRTVHSKSGTAWHNRPPSRALTVNFPSVIPEALYYVWIPGSREGARPGMTT